MNKNEIWDEFRATGLLLIVNQVLYLFGWAILFEMEEGKVVRVIPTRIPRNIMGDVVKESYLQVGNTILNDSVFLEGKNPHLRLTKITPKNVKEIPDELEHGILYISEEYNIAVHLCACGCGMKSVTPFNPKYNQWTLTKNRGKVTLSPSIGNFIGEEPYHAHYFIKNNNIEWCK